MSFSIGGQTSSKLMGSDLSDMADVYCYKMIMVVTQVFRGMYNTNAIDHSISIDQWSSLMFYRMGQTLLLSIYIMSSADIERSDEVQQQSNAHNSGCDEFMDMVAQYRDNVRGQSFL